MLHFNLAAALARLGALDEARAAVQAGLALNPGFTINRFRSGTPSDNPTFLAQRERIYQGMRTAGGTGGVMSLMGQSRRFCDVGVESGSPPTNGLHQLRLFLPESAQQQTPLFQKVTLTAPSVGRCIKPAAPSERYCSWTKVAAMRPLLARSVNPPSAAASW